MFGEITNWLLGAVSVALGTGALFAAAQTGHGVGYYVGLAMFAFCVLFVFILIKTSFDTNDQSGP